MYAFRMPAADAGEQVWAITDAYGRNDGPHSMLSACVYAGPYLDFNHGVAMRSAVLAFDERDDAVAMHVWLRASLRASAARADARLRRDAGDLAAGTNGALVLSTLTPRRIALDVLHHYAGCVHLPLLVLCAGATAVPPDSTIDLRFYAPPTSTTLPRLRP